MRGAPVLTRFLSLGEKVRTSYWFIPALMAIAAFLMAIVTLSLDHRWIDAGLSSRFGLIWGGGGEGARELLSTIAGSMITVAGVTFSIAVVAFMQASIQHGPHILRNFMRDLGNQIVMGTFIATFIYSILVLRTIRTSVESEFIPNLSITLSVVLSLASIGVLIYFIHHATVSIQAPQIASHVARLLFKGIDHMFPQKMGIPPREEPHPAERELLQKQLEENAAEIRAAGDGYIDSIDERSLMNLASKRELVLLVEYRPGMFVTRNAVLVRAHPIAAMNTEIDKKIRKAFIIEPQQTYTQDVELAIHQLVEIAVRALSPGVNDPFSAIICLDWLGAALSRMAEMDFPSRYRYDRNGSLRVFLRHPYTFAGMVDASLNQIRQFANGHVSVRIRLLDTIISVMAHTRSEDDRQALLRQARMVERESQPNTPVREDLRDIEDQFRELISQKLP